MSYWTKIPGTPRAHIFHREGANNINPSPYVPLALYYLTQNYPGHCLIIDTAFFIIVIAFVVKSATMNPPRPHPSLALSATEMNGKFLEGFTSPYDLYTAESKMSGAGFGLFVREEVLAGKEVFRVAVPTVSVV